ncbi:hypothetical protein B7L70_09525 [Vulcanisaeta sp. EB80]|uniref:hypothetical protein n=1 Tax=Vulcanisaeta sp. EB80 TaxID=1650660 RepID=UPI0009C03931|nr:hypothetical protein [Vulcanisaeta sp. EB80]PLC66970.1 hypothetical protein B7L70_09525 [Vulcanisaeta sp. EB80]
MINRMRIGRRAPILLLMALAVVATIALADAIFVYTGYINVKPMTTPLVFSTGPNGNAQPYISFTVSPNYDSFTVTLEIANSTASYYYQVGQLTVNMAGYIYVNSINLSGSAVNTMTIYIQSTSGSTQCTFQVISGGSTATTPSTSCPLNAGNTYYISIKVVPNLPVTSSSIETVTVQFGYNVVGNTVVPVP